METTTTYAQGADAAYRTAFAAADSEDVSFWQLCHGFDTMLDFYALTGANADVDAQTIYELLGKKIGGLSNINTLWFDDLGWATIAAKRASESQQLVTTRKKFEDFAGDCWQIFAENAPKVWERRDTNRHFEAYGPLVAGGVWNEYWLGTSYPGPHDGDPTKGTLQGIQNTVTNAIFLVAAQHMAKSTGESQEAAHTEFGFLKTWMSAPGSQWWSEDSTTGSALVRERVDLLAKRLPAPGFCRSWAWTGDQALMIGALAGRVAAEPGAGPELKAWVGRLLKGTLIKQVDGSVLLPATPGPNPWGDPGDYDTGTAVFWRYVCQLQDSPFADLLDASRVGVVLEASAKAALDAPGTTFVAAINDLATLVAACRLLN